MCIALFSNTHYFTLLSPYRLKAYYFSIASPLSALSLVGQMASLQVKGIGEEWDSGLGTISKTSAASTDDMSIITSGLRSEVSDEFQVRA